jgi:hypothetical protein
VQGTDILISTAAIGVTLAGFIGVVAALGNRSQGRWRSAETLRLGFMLAASLLASVFSYLPLIIYHLGTSASDAWTYSSAALAINLIALSVIYRVGRSKLPPDERAEFSWKFRIPIQITLVLALIYLVRNTLRIPLSGFGPYLLGVLWLLGLAAFQFTRLLFGKDP